MKNVLEFEGNSNSITIDVLEEAIRGKAREVIEALYEDEVQRFLNATNSLVDENGNRMVVRNGYHKERTVLTTSGYVKVRLPRIDDRATLLVSQVHEHSGQASRLCPDKCKRMICSVFMIILRNIGRI